MSNTKKPRKKYVPRAIRIPAVAEIVTVLDHDPHLATRLYAAIIAFCECPSAEACNNLSHHLCCIAGGMSHANKGAAILHKKDAASLAIKSAILCIEGIGDRYERTGAVSVSELEAKTLHAAAGKLDEALARMPLTCYRKGEKEIGLWLREKSPMQEAA